MSELHDTSAEIYSACAVEIAKLQARIHALETALAEISESGDCGGTWCAARAGRALEKPREATKPPRVPD